MSSRTKRKQGIPSRPTGTPALIVVILLTALIPVTVYAWLSIETANDMRLRTAMDRNLDTVLLSGKLVDEQYQTAISAVGQVVRSDAMAKAIEARRADSVRSYLSDAMHAVPELELAACYAPDGKLIARFPESGATDDDVVSSDWHKRARNDLRPFNIGEIPSPTAQFQQSVGLVFPVRSGDRYLGCVLAYYGVAHETNAWLHQLQLVGGTLYMIDAKGRVAMKTGPELRRTIDFSQYTPFRRAIGQRSGVMSARLPWGRGKGVVAYTYATEPGWAVLLAQPLEDSMQPTDYLLGRLSIVGAWALATFLAGAWWIVDLYSRQGALSRQLTEQNTKLEAASRAKSEFLANVSHELRTPLHIATVSITSLMDPSVSWNRKEVRKRLEIACEELDAMDAEIRNLLVMARLEGEAFQLEKVPCDLTDIVAGVIERMENSLHGRNIRRSFPESALMIEADPIRVETVIANLLENALKYSPPGSPISLTGELRPPFVHFAMKDEGPGITPGDEEKAFDKFWRAEANPKIPGTGLGLSICKAVIESHGGNIGVRRRDGGGSEFWFTLPALSDDEVEPEDMTGGSHSEDEPGEAANGNGRPSKQALTEPSLRANGIEQIDEVKSRSEGRARG